MSKKKLSSGQLFLMGGALFSMHFGGSSMIWPMTWGKESGTSVLPAFLGAYLTAVFIPFLGYIALARGKGTFYQISTRVSDNFAKLFCYLTIIVLGPLFVIPRMSAASWDAFLQITGFNPSSLIPVLIFSIIYYTLVYWFISKRDETIDKVGKILLPVLLLTVVGIFVKGFINPIGSQVAKTYSQPPFVYGFLEGYATMELPCALIFAVIIINNLKAKGVNDKGISKHLMVIGLIGTGILTLTHLGHMVLGSLTGDTFAGIKYSALYAEVVVHLWGTVGGILFNVGLLFAALTTAIGLTASTSAFFDEVTDKTVSYNKAALVIVALSGLVSIVGLENIIIFTEPLLKIIYPPAIVLTLSYALIPNLINNERLLSGMRYGAKAALSWGIFEGALAYAGMFSINLGFIDKIYNIIPLSEYGLGWIVIVLISAIIGLTINNKKKILVNQKG